MRHLVLDLSIVHFTALALPPPTNSISRLALSNSGSILTSLPQFFLQLASSIIRIVALLPDNMCRSSAQLSLPITLQITLLSGRTQPVAADPSWTVKEFRAKLQRQLKLGIGSLVTARSYVTCPEICS